MLANVKNGHPEIKQFVEFVQASAKHISDPGPVLVSCFDTESSAKPGASRYPASSLKNNEALLRAMDFQKFDFDIEIIDI